VRERPLSSSSYLSTCVASAISTAAVDFPPRQSLATLPADGETAWRPGVAQRGRERACVRVRVVKSVLSPGEPVATTCGSSYFAVAFSVVSQRRARPPETRAPQLERTKRRSKKKERRGKPVRPQFGSAQLTKEFIPAPTTHFDKDLHLKRATGESVRGHAVAVIALNIPIFFPPVCL